MGRQGLGSDANPLAWILTSAKVNPPTRRAAFRRIDALAAAAGEASTRDVHDNIRMLFSDYTLRRLVWLKSELNLKQRTDRFLMGVLLGRLHANADRQGIPRGLTVAMPNTFAMAPAYVSRYIADKHLQAPVLDPVAFLRQLVEKLAWPPPGFAPGRAWIQDARDRPRWPSGTPKSRLIFTSPPYLSVMNYGKFNWVRLWMLGEDPKSVDADLFSSSSLHLYRAFLCDVVTSLRTALRDDGYLCLVIGDVRQGECSINLASEVAEDLESSNLRLIGTVVDELPADQKVSRIWGTTRGRATNVDRILVLGGPRAPQPKAVPNLKWKEL